MIRKQSAILLVALIAFVTGCKDKVEFADYDFGGSFQLTDQNGKSFDSTSLKGKTVLLFFGYTTCPDICPTTLSKMKAVREMLGDDAADVQPVFISVDPDRDTPAKLKEYLAYFEVPVIGLTGNKAQIDRVVSDYKATYAKVGLGKDSELKYLVEHTSYIYLIDGNGKIRYLFKQDVLPEQIAETVQALQAI